MLENAHLHNLKNVSVKLPLGVMCGIAGVAGSGKSSLMECFRNAYPHPEHIVYISQKSIGISLRSTPATYLDVADDIRKLFAKTNKTKTDLFSFNGKGGWRWIRYAHSGLFDLDKKIKDYTPEELDLFLNSPQIKLKNPPSNWPKTAKYEGLIPRMYRSIITFLGTT